MFKLIDTHCHLNFPDFNGDRSEVIEKTLREKVGIIVVGTCADSSKQAVEIANNHGGGVYASIGLHPGSKEKFDYDYFLKLAKKEKVVGIGECGLEYFHIKDTNHRIRQKEIFKKQIELAIELNKPLIIHCRDAHNDVLDILNSCFIIPDSALRGVIHFFSGSWKQAQKYFELGFLISFTGVVTFTSDYDEIIRKIPLKKIMIETDAPFVAPVPYRGKRNEPLYVVEVAKKIAEIKNIPYEEVAKTTTENAIKLFNLDA